MPLDLASASQSYLSAIHGSLWTSPIITLLPILVIMVPSDFLLLLIAHYIFIAYWVATAVIFMLLSSGKATRAFFTSSTVLSFVTHCCADACVLFKHKLPYQAVRWVALALCSILGVSQLVALCLIWSLQRFSFSLGAMVGFVATAISLSHMFFELEIFSQYPKARSPGKRKSSAASIEDTATEKKAMEMHTIKASNTQVSRLKEKSSFSKRSKNKSGSNKERESGAYYQYDFLNLNPDDFNPPDTQSSSDSTQGHETVVDVQVHNPPGASGPSSASENKLEMKGSGAPPGNDEDGRLASV